MKLQENIFQNENACNCCLLLAVYCWKKNNKAKFCYLQYETTVTTAETSSRGQHRLICDMVLFTSSAGCPHCTPAHSTPWEESGNRFTARIFHPAPSEKSLEIQEVLLTFRKCPVRWRGSKPAGEQVFLCDARKGTVLLKKQKKQKKPVMLRVKSWLGSSPDAG